jgi:hypothetical protein
LANVVNASCKEAAANTVIVPDTVGVPDAVDPPAGLLVEADVTDDADVDEDLADEPHPAATTPTATRLISVASLAARIANLLTVRFG